MGKSWSQGHAGSERWHEGRKGDERTNPDRRMNCTRLIIWDATTAGESSLPAPVWVGLVRRRLPEAGCGQPSTGPGRACLVPESWSRWGFSPGPADAGLVTVAPWTGRCWRRSSPFAKPRGHGVVHPNQWSNLSSSSFHGVICDQSKVVVFFSLILKWWQLTNVMDLHFLLNVSWTWNPCWIKAT